MAPKRLDVARGQAPPRCHGTRRRKPHRRAVVPVAGPCLGAHLRPGSSLSTDAVKLRCRGLGGQTADQEVPLEAVNGDPVLCILDSDRNHPTAELGQTAKAAIRAIDALATETLTHIEPLRARDVENILPLPLVELAARGTHWLSPMLKRGFFARPAVDPALAYIDLGKDQCERRLLDTRDPLTRRYRSTALIQIRQIDPMCATSANACGRLARNQPACDCPWSDLDASCIIVYSVGKTLLRRIIELVDDKHENSDRSVADWLANMLPPNDPAVLDPARLAWSWGLRLRPRVRTV